MGLFQVKKISMKKEVSKENSVFYLDCHKLKEVSKFKSCLLKDLIGDKRYLVVIDTNLTYRNVSGNHDKNVDKLFEFLDHQGIKYKNIVIKNDVQVAIAGVPIKVSNKEKVKSYSVGFIITSDEVEMLEGIADKFNTYYYAILEDTGNEEILNEYDKVRGDKEELNLRFGYYIVYDDYVHVIRLCTNKDKEQVIEQIIKKNIDKIRI